MHNWIIQSVPLIQSVSFSCLTIECCPAYFLLYFYLTSTNWPGLVTDNPLSETNGSPSLTTKNVQISTIRKTWDSNFHQVQKSQNLTQRHDDQQYCASFIWTGEDVWLSSSRLSLEHLSLGQIGFACLLCLVRLLLKMLGIGVSHSFIPSLKWYACLLKNISASTVHIVPS